MRPAPTLFFSHSLTLFIHVSCPSWISFHPSHLADVIRSLEVAEGILGRRRCARAKLVVQLRERYRRLITRGIVTFNFSPRDLSPGLCCTWHWNAQCAVWSALSTQCTVNLEHSNALSTQCTVHSKQWALSTQCHSPIRQ